jgi:GrpB-like predicted nucleotidyltransferase (UPF0157 family)
VIRVIATRHSSVVAPLRWNASVWLDRHTRSTQGQQLSRNNDRAPAEPSRGTYNSEVLVAYDPRWPHEFQVVADELHRLGNARWPIEHIGSTAIPGMLAKPIIDVAVCIENQQDFEAHRPRLEASGWSVGSGVRTHRVMVYEPAGIRTRIAHFFEEADWATVNQRILRDWLRAHARDAERYQTAKAAAAEAAREGIASYNQGKTAVIQDILDRARAASGLPARDAYDK